MITQEKWNKLKKGEAYGMYTALKGELEKQQGEIDRLLEMVLELQSREG